jgi:hypothetical protein
VTISHRQWVRRFAAEVAVVEPTDQAMEDLFDPAGRQFGLRGAQPHRSRVGSGRVPVSSLRRVSLSSSQQHPATDRDPQL